MRLLLTAAAPVLATMLTVSDAPAGTEAPKPSCADVKSVSQHLARMVRKALFNDDDYRLSVHRVTLLSRPIIPGEAGKQVSRGCVFRVSGSMWARNTKGELGAYFVKASIVHASRVSSPNVVDFDIDWVGLDETTLAQSPSRSQPPKAE